MTRRFMRGWTLDLLVGALVVLFLGLVLWLAAIAETLKGLP